MTPLQADTAFVVTMTVLPAALIIRYGLLGLPLGVLLVWGVGIASGEILSAMDPQRENAIGDVLWVAFGWIGGLIYCGLIYLIRETIAVGIRRYRTAYENKSSTDQGSSNP